MSNPFAELMPVAILKIGQHCDVLAVTLKKPMAVDKGDLIELQIGGDMLRARIVDCDWVPEWGGHPRILKLEELKAN